MPDLVVGSRLPRKESLRFDKPQPGDWLRVYSGKSGALLAERRYGVSGARWGQTNWVMDIPGPVLAGEATRRAAILAYRRDDSEPRRRIIETLVLERIPSEPDSAPPEDG